MFNNKKIVGIFVGALLVVGGIAFYGGMKYETSQASAVQTGSRDMGSGRGNFTGAAGRTRGGSGGGLMGEVLTVDAQSISVKSRDGSSKIVILASSTKVTKGVTAALPDVTVGNEVVVNGKVNPDGSITAEQIQIRGGAAQVLPTSK